MKVTEHTIEWQGMAVSIRHVANWSGTGVDHIEVRSITPERAALPITADVAPCSALGLNWTPSEGDGDEEEPV